MSRPCFVLSLLLFSMAGSLFAVSSAKCQSGSGYGYNTRTSCMYECPLFYDELNQCMLGQCPAADPQWASPEQAATSRSVVDPQPHASVAAKDASKAIADGSSFRSGYDTRYDYEVYGICPAESIVPGSDASEADKTEVASGDQYGYHDYDASDSSKSEARYYYEQCFADPIRRTDECIGSGLRSPREVVNEFNSETDGFGEPSYAGGLPDSECFPDSRCWPEADQADRWSGDPWYDDVAEFEATANSTHSDVAEESINISAFSLPLQRGLSDVLQALAGSGPGQAGSWIAHKAVSSVHEIGVPAWHRLVAMLPRDAARMSESVATSVADDEVLPVEIAPANPPRLDGGRQLLLFMAEAMDQAAGTLHMASQSLSRIAVR